MRRAVTACHRVPARVLAGVVALTALLWPAAAWGADTPEPASVPVLDRVSQVAPPGAADPHVFAPFLLVLAPADGQRVGASSVEVTGRTNPGRAVLVLNDEALFEAAVDDAGEWSVWVDLFPGDNDLVVLTVDPHDASAPILDEDLFVVCEPFARI